MVKIVNAGIGWGVAALLLLAAGCGGMSLVKADFKMAQEAYDEAIPIYEAYVKDNPDAVDPRNRLGFAYLKTGKLDAAIDAFQTVLQLEPGDPYAVLYLGMAHLNKEEFGKAIEVWQGYRNNRKPLVEDEIRRLITIVRIAESQQAAKRALADENTLETVAAPANSVAVCYYEDFSSQKDLAAFQKGLAAMVITDLAKVKQLQVVERVRLQALLQEMKLGQTGIVDPKTAPRVGRLLGVENLVVGGLAEGIQVTTTVSSTQKSEVVGGASATIARDQFFEIPQRIVLEVAKIMAIELTPDEVAAIGVPHTTNYKAFVYYGQALDAMDAGHWSKAKDFFSLALKEDPGFGLAAEGSQSCPSDTAPAIDQLALYKSSEWGAWAEDALQSAEKQQSQADEAAQATKGGGDGGH